MMNLTERASRYLGKLPPAISGSNGHDATFKAACALVHGYTMDVATAFPLLAEWNLTHCSPPWSESELRHKLETALKSNSLRGRGYLLGDREPPQYNSGRPSRRRGRNAGLPPFSEDEGWPKRDLDAIRRIGLNGHGQSYLFDLSPVQPGDMDTEDYIDVLFPGDALLCVGARMNEAETKLRSEFRGTLSNRQFIVPSVMAAERGLTQKEKPSPRTLTNTGPRSYLVIECDFSLKKADGSATAEAPLLKELAANGRTVADLCASVLLWLGSFAPLAMIVSSGGKSLHGWFPRQKQTEDKLRRFMRYAVTIGADYHTWTPCQFVRMPEAKRDNGRLQSVQYFNPDVIK